MIKVISSFLFTILELSALWSMLISISAIRKFNKYCESHHNLECRGKVPLILSLIGSFTVFCISPILYYIYLSLFDKKVLNYFVSLSFLFVFTAVFMNMTVIYSNFYKDFKIALGGDKILMEMNLCDEWCLAVGFLCSGGFAVLYCSC